MIRPCRSEECEVIHQFILDLAEYEGAREEVKASAEDLRQALFREPFPQLYCHVVDLGEGKVIAGMAIWHLNYSTWTGKHGIYLEDLYITPTERGKGYGSRLLQTLAGICKSRGYSRLQWWCLDSNTPSIEFYTSSAVKAQPMDQWTVFRVDGEALDTLAARIT